MTLTLRVTPWVVRLGVLRIKILAREKSRVSTHTYRHILTFLLLLSSLLIAMNEGWSGSGFRVALRLDVMIGSEIRAAGETNTQGDTRVKLV